MRKWTRVGFQPNLPLEEKRRVTECKEHIRLSKEAAKEGMVLLKNEKKLLPLACITFMMGLKCKEMQLCFMNPWQNFTEKMFRNSIGKVQCQV